MWRAFSWRPPGRAALVIFFWAEMREGESRVDWRKKGAYPDILICDVRMGVGEDLSTGDCYRFWL